MHVLFVYSKGSKEVGRPTIESQARALESLGIKVTMQPLAGKGMRGYLDRLKQLKKAIQKYNPDLIHAHYSYNGFVSSMASHKPVITSLMGTDVNGSSLWKPVIRYFMKHKWSTTIMKSIEMQNELRSNVSFQYVIPNGVDLGKFKPLEKMNCRNQLGWDENKTIILFGAMPDNSLKNFKLATNAFNLLKDDNFEMKTLDRVSHDHVPLFLNAADILLLTSKSEGSPNIIKEAMACNTPIITTDVGDVKWLLDGVSNCVIVPDDPTTIADHIQSILKCTSKSNGRDRILELSLDSNSVAGTVKGLYSKILSINNE
jgi:glycosyltransferase involved in cell wall biosynthesis